MTSPSALPPHQDPAVREDPAQVSMMEHITTLVATLDRRFDMLHQDLKDSINQRFTDADLRYQQRFDAQTKALDAALAAQKEAVQTALAAAEKATTKAEVASDKRFDSVNEFRQTLTDQALTFMPRAEAEARLGSLAEKVDDLKSVVHAGLSDLNTKLAAASGRGSGLQAGWAYLLGGVGLLVTIINLLSLWAKK